jgi:hypothetical protein
LIDLHSLETEHIIRVGYILEICLNKARFHVVKAVFLINYSMPYASRILTSLPVRTSSTIRVLVLILDSGA